MVTEWWLLLALGLAIGTLGSLIGVGGGFILAPVLLVLMPKADAVSVSSISLAVVFMNGASGSIAYARMGRVDIKSAIIFSVATFPGAIIGALSTKWVERHLFDAVFGTLLLIAAVYLLFKPTQVKDSTAEPSPKHTKREITDVHGTTHVYHFSMPIGIGLSVLVGYVSSFLGIGGGIVHVPVMTRTLNFPVHIATATSHVTLALMALTGTIVHLIQGDLRGQYATVAYLGVGAIVGAQVGARISNKLEGAKIMRVLAIAVGVMGIRLLVTR